MINIILTLDYEIFGDGTGDVRKHMIRPTERILKVCNIHKVPLVIMFEFIEYMKFKEYDNHLNSDLGYSPARLIESQITNAFTDGHDVQLHIHHPWIGARYEKCKWLINNWEMSIEELSVRDIDELISLAKSQLESILREIRPNYRCVAIRFTNLPWIEAPPLTIRPMVNNRIKIHSLSVAQESKNKERGYWALDSEGKVFEFPIHSQRVPFYRMFSFNIIRNEVYRRWHSIFMKPREWNEYQKKKEKRLSAICSIKDGYNLKWDFCKLSARKMIELLRIGLSRYDSDNYEVPLILIGHSKDLFKVQELDKFLKVVNKEFVSKGIVRFTTFANFVEENLH